MSKPDDLTPKILEKIHREIQKTNQGLEHLRTDTNRQFAELREDATRRLDLLTEAATRTNTELVGVKQGLASLEKTVERNGERFEHALGTQGVSHRELEARVKRLEHHVGLEP